MNKSMLIIDTPKNCDECEVKCDGYTAKQYAEKGITRPSWCPLKPLPQKQEQKDEEVYQFSDYKEGWNDCIDELLKETE